MVRVASMSDTLLTNRLTARDTRPSPIHSAVIWPCALATFSVAIAHEPSPDIRRFWVHFFSSAPRHATLHVGAACTWCGACSVYAIRDSLVRWRSVVLGRALALGSWACVRHSVTSTIKSSINTLPGTTCASIMDGTIATWCHSHSPLPLPLSHSHSHSLLALPLPLTVLVSQRPPENRLHTACCMLHAGCCSRRACAWLQGPPAARVCG
jgi:hypothetical protein